MLPATPRAVPCSHMFCTAQLVAAISSHSGCSFPGLAWHSNKCHKASNHDALHHALFLQVKQLVMMELTVPD